MSRSLVAGIVAVLALVATALAGAPALAQGKSSSGSTDVGITPTTIRVAVVADVDNQVVPGVLQGIVDGVQGWGKYVNANGGIAKRKVQVDFIDSHLDANAARNAIIKACSEDFALVGTSALLLQTVDDEVNCADSTGKATGLPDLASIPTTAAEGCAPNAFPITPTSGECSTVHSSPQTYRANNGDSKYFLKTFGNLHGSFVLANDSPSVRQSSTILFKAAQAAGVKSDHEWPVSGFAPQTVYTPIIQGMKSDNSNYGLSLQAVTGVVQERQEAQLQGLTDPKIVWECTLACYYDKGFVKAGSAVDGEYMPLTVLPFTETSTNKTLANFVKYVGKDKLSGFASWGFTAGLLFQQAANAVVAKDGNNGLTRANLLAELKTIHDFNGGGMVGTTDIGNKVPTSCFLLEQYKNAKFVRVYPTKQGTFDCKSSNLYTFKEDLNNQ